MQKKNLLQLIAILVLGVAGSSWAAAPDLLPPLSMALDPDFQTQASGLDFLDHPQSGSENFSPNNYEVHLPGGEVLPIQDVVPYAGIRMAIKDCKDYADLSQKSYTAIKNGLSSISKATGMTMPNLPSTTEYYNAAIAYCEGLDMTGQVKLFATAPYAQQNVGDVRNTSSGSTELLFSGQGLEPYLGGFPTSPAGYAGAVIASSGAADEDVWSDGVVVAGYEPVFGPTIGGSLLFHSSLALYRFNENASQDKALAFSDYSSAWMDKPAANNSLCYKNGKPKGYGGLQAAGCVGEHWPVAIAAVNLFGHAGDKTKDLVVASRALMGDSNNDTTARIGYLTIYKHTGTTPTATQKFQDIWQFEKSVTHVKNGIPEPYGIAVIKDKMPGGNKESVVVSSNMAVSNQYAMYRYAAGMAEPQPIAAGCIIGACPVHFGFGPYKVYSADINQDGCGDIFLTRAKIELDALAAPKIEFASYFEVYLQQQTADKGCTGNFAAGVKYEIPSIASSTKPQISSLAIADFNKDGLLDVIAGDFRTYPNTAAQSVVNYVHYLENINGLLNTLQGLPRFQANTQLHGTNVGVIDVKADKFGHVGVVIGKPVAFAPVTAPKITVINSCDVLKTVKDFDPAICNCSRDLDDDKKFDINVPKTKKIQYFQCDGSTIAGVMTVDNTKYTLKDCVTGNNVTMTGRAWLLEWAKDTDGNKCDNCSQPASDVCTSPDANGSGSLCYNPSQDDDDLDGFGNTCDKDPADDSISALPRKMIPVARAWRPLREDRVVSLDDGPVLAHWRDLRPTQAMVLSDAGHEVTVLLNKSQIKEIKTKEPGCTDGDLACICQINPALQVCKCFLNPDAPECLPISISQPSCCLDTCRGDLTAPFPAMCDFIRPYNDQIRKITGLCMDVLVPAEGTQWHLSCKLPNTPAVDLGAGNAYVQVFKTGQVPKNYFKEWHKPVASENVLAQPVLLNPPSEEISANVNFNVSNLPAPNFDFSALQAVVPDATLTQTAGIAQIDGIMQIETYLSDVNAAVGAPAGKAAAGAGQKELLLDIKGFSSPPGCQWGGDDCPNPMPNTPPPQAFVDAIQAKVTEYEAAGKAITIDTINDAFKSMDVGPAFMHQQILLAGNQGITSIPLQNTMGALSVEGGCGCTISTAPSVRNTIVPLLMAAIALGAMAFFRRTIPKKD